MRGAFYVRFLQNDSFPKSNLLTHKDKRDEVIYIELSTMTNSIRNNVSIQISVGLGFILKVPQANWTS